MIKDKLENIERYSLNKFFEIFKAKITATSNYPEQLEAPLRAIPLEYDTKDFNLSKFENHKKNIDIHYIIEGTENIGITPVDNLNPNTKYYEEGDYQLFEGKIKETIVLEEGDILILFPGEAHISGGLVKEKTKVKKLVFKIPI